jgi:hypothetical protein
MLAASNGVVIKFSRLATAHREPGRHLTLLRRGWQR